MIRIVLNTFINLFNFQVQPSSSLLFSTFHSTKFAKSTRPEHVLGGPKQQIAKLNPAD
ncbi:hypothetical protein ACJIZ3_012065 [Penstemon smallii]|uniref:Uncharacterized protein n=1 Tax=Penstemon smallii TaxID=265156 RepID=A0ABD3UP49_9LAMI